MSRVELMPITKMIWWVKVGTLNMCACNLIDPITCVPVTSIFCTTIVNTFLHAHWKLILRLDGAIIRRLAGTISLMARMLFGACSVCS